MSLFKSSYRAQTVLLMGGLASSIVVVLALILGALVQRQISLTAKSAMEQAERAMAEEVRSRLAALETETALLSEHPGSKGLADIPRGENQETMEGFLRDNLSLLNVDWLAFVDLEGRVMASTRPSQISRDKVIDLSPDHANTWNGNLINDEAPTLAVAKPVYVGLDHKMNVVAGVDIGPRFLQKASVGIPANFALLNGEEVISSSQPLSEIRIANSTIAARSPQGVSIAAVPAGEGMRMAAFVDRSAAAEPLKPVLWALAIMAPTSIIAAIGFAYALSKRATAPLAELTQAARSLQEGHWPERLSAERKDEFGLLQAAFNEMITSVKSSRDELVAQLEVDPLTQVWNHRRFRGELAELMEQGAEPRAMALIDLNDFDGFNRLNGTARGDQELQLAASLIQSIVPEGALVGRYGGDVFAVAASPSQMEFMSARIHRALSEDSSSSASIGWAEASQEAKEPGMLCLAAEAALAEAKSAGKGTTRRFSGFMINGSQEEIREVFRSPSVAAVRALAEAVDAKDAYTRGHSQRVADYARELAEACGFDQGFVELVHMTGTLHDVGKIGVPDSVLGKTSRLTDDEFAQIKMHPELGEKIVREIPQLRETLSGIRGHHERWDGKGYPDRKAGQDISLLARVLAVADCYDAMTSDRPYRKGLPVETALAEIQKGAGTQFDPELAEVFVRIFRQKAA